MINILHVIGSPRKERSVSGCIARFYIEELQKNNPGSHLDVLDVWQHPIPEFNAHTLHAKYAGLKGLPLTEEQIKAWNTIKQVADRFHKADVIVFSVPMWNFGIPYKLKQLIDLISQKDVLFTFDERGFNGMLKNKKAILICSRGISYATGTDTPESEFDFQNAYMLLWFRFIGITDVTVIKVEQTLSETEAGAGALNHALQEARFAALVPATNTMSNPQASVAHIFKE